MILAAALTLFLNATVAPAKAAQLVPMTVTVSVINRSRNPVTLEFPSPDLFFVQVRDAKGTPVFDSRTGHKPIPVHRKMVFVVGRTKVESFDWSGLNDARNVVDPGQYVVHVEMAGVTQTLTADVPVTIDAPQTIDSVLHATTPAQATIAGTPEREGGTTYLRDASERIALSLPLGIRPQGTFVARGVMQTILNQKIFTVSRYSPAAENDAPEGTPTPRPLPSLAPSSLPRSR
ncbi:MAG: hypothetical protein JO349_00130 [Candidatus Eremiobacteraeota bacterium]|nr:hypothetical protein [Candidatus Eremiobacteraeota bacterium]